MITINCRSPAALKSPVRGVVTGAAGQIAYSLIYQLASGVVFGEDQPIILHLLDIPPMMGVLNGVCMEIQDSAMPLVAGVVPTDDVAVAFKDIDAAFLVGAMPRREGMERKDLLAANVKIFKVNGPVQCRVDSRDHGLSSSLSGARRGSGEICQEICQGFSGRQPGQH